MGRYKSDTAINFGKSLGNPGGVLRLRTAYENGLITVRQITLGTTTRIDHLAFQHMGDPSYWWAIAALSDIGWALQLPAGTFLIIPTSLAQVKEFE